jgi:aspartate-semialdehyde dehydrogenase
MSYNIAIIGATGNVGREVMNILHEREFPHKNLYAIASRESVGKKVTFGESNIVLPVENIEGFDFSKVDLAFFCTSNEVSKKYIPNATKCGTIVIDKSSHYRMDKDVPLLIPEVNPEALASYKNKNIIANPNCAITGILVALKPLHDFAKIKRLVVSTYQSVSGAGKDAMDELYNQTKSKFIFQETVKKVFEKQIAFNVIPNIGLFNKEGYSSEEEKIIEETHKILGENIKVTATCVRVPVFVGHSASVNIEFESEISAKKARSLLSKAKGIIVQDNDDDSNYATPIDSVQMDEVLVSRIREDKSVEYGLNMWVVCDNLRKGAALNAVQVAEMLIKEYL